MFELFRNFKKNVGFSSVVFIVFGIILFFFPYKASRMICAILAFVILINGIRYLIHYFSNENYLYMKHELFYGIILCLISGCIMVLYHTVMKLVPFIAGVFILFEGIMNVMKALQLQKYTYHRWYYEMILSIILVIIGFMMILNPFQTAILAIRIIGIALVYDGILNLIMIDRLNRYHF